MNAHAALLPWPASADDALGNALWTEDEVAVATGGVASARFACAGVAFDSREVGEGDLFVALKGEASDGHAHLDQAFARGASAAIVSRAIDRPHVLVADTAQALQGLAAASRERVNAWVIGVTGSAGKTGVKEALFASLDRASQGRAHRSLKSYNNHVGVPLSLARMPARTKFGVFEMGMNHPGELAELTRLVRPHVAIVTTIAPAHIGFFSGEEAIADAKGEIFEGLEDGGTAVIPADSPHYLRLRDKAERHASRIVGFGRAKSAQVRLLDAVPGPDGGTLVTADLGDRKICYTVSHPGDHWVTNSLAVIAAVRAVGGDLGAAGLALAEMEGLAGRGARHRLAAKGGDGSGRALLIDESYNANPASMRATIVQLGATAARRRIAVLGGMKELGAEEARYHAELAGPLAAAGIDHAVLVGGEMAALAEALGKSRGAALGKRIAVAHVATAAQALALLAGETIEGGDAVLVKGSNSVGLGAIVAALTAKGS
ncbi:MAG: UDP-N-acetylmuramoyl-tripeptide--D-alanyl-D-alanine ligase [Novosphingobium sp.]